MALKEGYIGVPARIAKFRTEHGTTGKIITEVQVFEKDQFAVVKASVSVNGEVIATGHDHCLDLGEVKALSKAETAAIGRALVNAGYESMDEEMEAEAAEKAPAQSAPARTGRTLTRPTETTEAATGSSEGTASQRVLDKYRNAGTEPTQSLRR